MGSYGPKSVAFCLRILTPFTFFVTALCANAQAPLPPLHEAAKQGDLDTLRRLLEGGAEVDALDSSGASALHLAVWSGNTRAAETLLDSGADLNRPYTAHYTPLHFAASAKEENVELVRLLISRGANVSQSGFGGESALGLAARRGYVQSIIALIDGQSEIDRGSIAPIEGAAELGHVNAVRILLERGARPFRGASGALRSGNARIMELLFSHGLEKTIHRAAAIGDTDTVISLLEENPDLVSSAKKFVNMRPAYTALALALRNGHLDVVRALLTRGASLEGVTQQTRALLHIAAEGGSVEAGQFLFDAGFDIEAFRSDGLTPLQVAVLSSKENFVNWALSVGADPNATNGKRMTPLHIAMVMGEGNIVDALRESGAEYGIHPAAATGDLETVRSLLVNDPSLIQSKTSRGETPLHLAAWRYHREVVEFLLDNGADPNMRSSMDRTPVADLFTVTTPEIAELLLKHGIDKDFQNKHWLGSIVNAVRVGRYDFIRWYIDRSPSLDIENTAAIYSEAFNPFGEYRPFPKALFTAYQAALKPQTLADEALIDRFNLVFPEIYLAIQSGELDWVRSCVEAGTDVNRPAGALGTPLAQAAYNGLRHIVDFLLQSGAHPNEPSLLGPPLIIASSQGFADVVVSLLEAGADPNTVDGRKTALIAACNEGRIMTVLALLAHGADPNKVVPNAVFASPLQAAHVGSYAALLRALLSAGADPNLARMRDGSTPLHQAVMAGDFVEVGLLTEFGGNPTIPNSDGKTALDLAREKGLTRITQALESAL